MSPWLLDLEVQDAKFQWSTCFYTPNHTVSHPGRLDSSVTALRERHNLCQQGFFCGRAREVQFHRNFTVLLPYKRHSLFMLLCSANQEDQTHNYILFGVNVCLTLFVVAYFDPYEIFFCSFHLLFLCYTLTLCSRPSQKPPSTVILNSFLVICIGMGVLETTLRLKRDSSCTNATLDSMSANRLPGTE